MAHEGVPLVVRTGEPLLHPDIDKIIAKIRSRGMLACMITNGYLLSLAALILLGGITNRDHVETGMREGFDCILIERETEYIADIRRRLAHVSGQDAPLFASAPLTPAP